MTRAGVRGATSACMLTTALLLGGPAAIAAADDGSSAGTGSSSSSSSESQSGGSAGGSPSSTSNSRTDFGSSLRDSVRKSLNDVRSTLGSLGDRQPKSGATPPTAGADADPGSELTPPASDAPDVTPEVAIDIVAPTAEDVVTPPTSTVPQPLPTVDPAPVGTAPLAVTAPRSVPTTPRVANSGRTPLPFNKVNDAVATVGDTVATVLDSTHDTVAALPALLAALPNSRTPVTDVITTIEYMLTSMTNSVSAITALPTDLSALMGVPVVAVPGVSLPPQTPRPVDLAPSSGVSALMWAPVQAAGGLSAPLAETPVGPSLLSASTVAGIKSAAIATPVPVGLRGIATSSTPDSFLDRAVTEVLLPLSLAALAAVALPGVGGLLVICALGVRIGYRQAKAGWAVHVAGIGRFAGAGPMGVVRSGSMVALHVPRGMRSRAVNGDPAVVRFLDRSDRAA